MKKYNEIKQWIDQRKQQTKKDSAVKPSSVDHYKEKIFSARDKLYREMARIVNETK
ncbi:MAG: hypothetical protein IJ728_04535 [Selenomonadaceae bacterium]|nr:hypothetical protein [Selenomonadaceae bacterium]